MNNTVKVLGTFHKSFGQHFNLYDSDHLAPTLMATMERGSGKIPMVLEIDFPFDSKYILKTIEFYEHKKEL